MASHKDMDHRMIRIVPRSPRCDMKEGVLEYPSLKRNQDILELDHLSRSGQVALKQISLGHLDRDPGQKVATTIH